MVTMKQNHHGQKHLSKNPAGHLRHRRVGGVWWKVRCMPFENDAAAKLDTREFGGMAHRWKFTTPVLAVL